MLQYHPKANVAKMHRGEPLTDADRRGWLEALGEHSSVHPEQDGSRHLIITCSALKRDYRDLLRKACDKSGDLQVGFIFLDAPESVLHERAVKRQGHFAKANLVHSQCEILERPELDEGDTIIVPTNMPLVEVKEECLSASKSLFGEN